MRRLKVRRYSGVKLEVNGGEPRGYDCIKEGKNSVGRLLSKKINEL
jgi:hypothetical protein